MMLAKVEDAASSAARLLGYECMKDNLVKEFVEGTKLYSYISKAS